MIRHIPAHPSKDPLGRLLTYCGREVSADRCIDLRTTAIDEAECKACQRSDNRREIAAHWAEVREIAIKNGHVPTNAARCRRCGLEGTSTLEYEPCIPSRRS